MCSTSPTNRDSLSESQFQKKYCFRCCLKTKQNKCGYPERQSRRRLLKTQIRHCPVDPLHSSPPRSRVPLTVFSPTPHSPRSSCVVSQSPPPPSVSSHPVLPLPRQRWSHRFVLSRGWWIVLGSLSEWEMRVLELLRWLLEWS